ncbi:hypothetical protein DPMN_043835 [Dreissena polymorpha]|uniref:Uncharacterized protein n=1 Tax=Dreissena polymorpha TaxID=45954 RepID=A0A9D4D1V1_DREPO|nr:hypothetical protein DPMN_043835 [Dreissena polymorpha]
MAPFEDPELPLPRVLHVTPAGQLLVSGWLSGTIIQVDSEGKRLATLTTKSNEVCKPLSVCYSRHTSPIFVGQEENDKILVFRVE